MEQQTLIPQIKINQGRNRAKAQTGHFFHPWGVGAAAYTQSPVTRYINEAASQQ